MSKRKGPPPQDKDNMGGPSGEFDLGRPQDPGFRAMAAQPETASVALSGKISDPSGANKKPPLPEGESKFKPMTWKGFEEEEPVETLPFGKRAPRQEAEMDMTPMVDVTFLLLIFFMVTASFKLQKAIQQQPDTSDEPSEVVMEQQEQRDAIQVYIDENDNFFLTSSDVGEEMAAGKVEMWQKLAKMKLDSPNIRKLVIKANEASSHGAVINVWDAGADAKIFEIAISVVNGP
ncbi:MAG: biopolymer transporter ExbD [Planctomycetaceae bacterium]|nr:biopolymer transporter ExbD [Planctomycetaceae bacterium]